MKTLYHYNAPDLTVISLFNGRYQHTSAPFQEAVVNHFYQWAIISVKKSKQLKQGKSVLACSVYKLYETNTLVIIIKSH